MILFCGPHPPAHSTAAAPVEGSASAAGAVAAAIAPAHSTAAVVTYATPVDASASVAGYAATTAATAAATVAACISTGDGSGVPVRPPCCHLKGSKRPFTD